MLKNLTTECFRGLVRQNELIEVGLTHHFDAMDVDMSDMHARAAAMGKKFACQFIKSASIPVAGFDLPIDVGTEPGQFEVQEKQLASIVELAQEIRAPRCRLEIPATGHKVYHENFELLRQRIVQIADVCAPAGISIGLMLQRNPAHRGFEYQFVQKADELLMLIKMIGKKNVGLALDTCSWMLAGGSLESLCKIAKHQWVDVQLCDPAASANLQSTADAARCLPGTNEDSICVDLVKHLSVIGYEGPLAATAHPSQLGLSKSGEIGARLADVLNEIMTQAGAAPAEAAAS